MKYDCPICDLEQDWHYVFETKKKLYRHFVQDHRLVEIFDFVYSYSHHGLVNEEE